MSGQEAFIFRSSPHREEEKTNTPVKRKKLKTRVTETHVTKKFKRWARPPPSISISISLFTHSSHRFSPLCAHSLSHSQGEETKVQKRIERISWGRAWIR